ncbi:hypothetical protein [Bacillus mobilis]|uniref:hypothetical protein n=1 Tax=Bacillus mobilis TaxID=2026190 RepID=UPI0013748492|nr:hypothetical protein [Bacillus mobilis]
MQYFIFKLYIAFIKNLYGIHSDWLYFSNPKTSTDKWITTRQTVAVIGNHAFAK